MKNLPVIILAGGLATRLRPLTTTIPKSLVEVNGEPFIAHQLRLLQQNNIREVILSLGFLGEQIVDYVGDGSRFQLKVSYVFDGPSLLGTGGAIKKALSLVEDAFFVLYGDSYLPCDYAAVAAFYAQNSQPALMTVFRNLGLWDTSNVEYQDHRIIQYDKVHRTERMQYIDYGLGIFKKELFANIPQHEPSDLAHFYQALLRNGQLAGYEIKQRFYEVGSFNGIHELEQYLRAQHAVY